MLCIMRSFFITPPILVQKSRYPEILSGKRMRSTTFTTTPTLVCSGKPMVCLEANTVDAAQEKHVPVVERIEGGWKVTVGSVLHPMTEEHYIQWIELHTKNAVMRKELTPQSEPLAVFRTTDEVVCVREYCNLHGLWAK